VIISRRVSRKFCISVNSSAVTCFISKYLNVVKNHTYHKYRK